jgi:hypothetical protein
VVPIDGPLICQHSRLPFFKGPRPFKSQKTNFSGLTTQNAPRLNRGLSAAKNTIAGRTLYKSSQYREVPSRYRLRLREVCFKIEIMKKTFPVSA